MSKTAPQPEISIIPAPDAPKKHAGGRPKGARNRRPTKKGSEHGNTQRTKIPEVFKTEDIIWFKTRILEYIVEGKARNLTEACDLLRIPPARAYNWYKADPDFAELMRSAREVQADKIESAFLSNPQWVIPNMMILKGIRPMYRENYRVDFNTTRMEELIAELKAVAKQQALPPATPSVAVEAMPQAQLPALASKDAGVQPALPLELNDS